MHGNEDGEPEKTMTGRRDTRGDEWENKEGNQAEFWELRMETTYYVYTYISCLRVIASAVSD